MNTNYQLLVAAARLLVPLLDELVFVGGCATGLMITDKAAASVRPTFDVDAIAEVTSYAGYVNFSQRLRAMGFTEDTDKDAPLAAGNTAKSSLMLCHWTRRSSGSRIDGIQPPCKQQTGFRSNPRFRSA